MTNDQPPQTQIEGLKYPDAVRLAEKLIAGGFHVEVVTDNAKTLWPRYTVKAWAQGKEGQND